MIVGLHRVAATKFASFFSSLVTFASLQGEILLAWEKERNLIVPLFFSSSTWRNHFIQALLLFPYFASGMSQQLPANLVETMDQRMKLIEQRSAYLQEQINQVISDVQPPLGTFCTVVFIVVVYNQEFRSF